MKFSIRLTSAIFCDRVAIILDKVDWIYEKHLNHASEKIAVRNEVFQPKIALIVSIGNHSGLIYTQTNIFTL